MAHKATNIFSLLCNVIRPFPFVFDSKKTLENQSLHAQLKLIKWNLKRATSYSRFWKGYFEMLIETNQQMRSRRFREDWANFISFTISTAGVLYLKGKWIGKTQYFHV